MIQVNIALNTKDGLQVPANSVINIIMSFVDERQSIKDPDGVITGWIIKRNIVYGLELFKSMNDYETGMSSVNTALDQFPFTYVKPVTLAELQTITNIGIPQQWLADWIESIIGAGTTSIVYPSIG